MGEGGIVRLISQQVDDLLLQRDPDRSVEGSEQLVLSPGERGARECGRPFEQPREARPGATHE
jgi:hypothetical protein